MKCSNNIVYNEDCFHELSFLAKQVYPLNIFTFIPLLWTYNIFFILYCINSLMQLNYYSTNANISFHFYNISYLFSLASGISSQKFNNYHIGPGFKYCNSKQLQTMFWGFKPRICLLLCSSALYLPWISTCFILILY